MQCCAVPQQCSAPAVQPLIAVILVCAGSIGRSAEQWVSVSGHGAPKHGAIPACACDAPPGLDGATANERPHA